MAEFARKWQAILSLVLMILMVGLAWGKIDSRVTAVENVVQEERLAKKEIVDELRKIREEIVHLRIAQATTNQRLVDHIEAE